MSNNNSDFILTSLKAKYNKDFEVLNTEFIWELGRSRAEVAPLDNPKLSFIVEYKKDGSFFLDYYIQALHNAQASDFVKKYWAKINLPMVSNVSGRYEKEVDAKILPSYESLIETDPENIVLITWLYFFVDSMDEVIPEIIKFDQLLRPIGFEKMGITVVAYDKNSLDIENLSQYKFGFRNIGDDTYEWNNKDAALGKINYYLNKDEKSSPSIEDLKAITKDNPNSIKFSFL